MNNELDMDVTSVIIRNVENDLNATSFLRPFSFEILTEDYEDKVWWFRWDATSNKDNNKKYRIYLVSATQEGDTLFRRPFIETKIEFRIRFAVYLHKFVDAARKEIISFTDRESSL